MDLNLIVTPIGFTDELILIRNRKQQSKFTDNTEICCIGTQYI